VASRPTGIYVVLGEITEVVYEELALRQIKVGRDVEILTTGHEASELSLLEPQPATLDLNIEELASRAIEKVLCRINNPDAPFGTVTWVPSTLVDSDGRRYLRLATVENEQEVL